MTLSYKTSGGELQGGVAIGVRSQHGLLRARVRCLGRDS